MPHERPILATPITAMNAALDERDRLAGVIARAKEELLAAKLAPESLGNLSRCLEAENVARFCGHDLINTLARIIKAIGILREAETPGSEGMGD
jgi:hypothetical protein